MGRFFNSIIILLFAFNVHSKVLVLEYIGNDQEKNHGESVESIACTDTPTNCHTYFTHTFTEETLSFLLNSKTESFSSINMSFVWEDPHWQEPRFKTDSNSNLSTEEYYKEKEEFLQAKMEFKNAIPLFQEVFAANPNSLFVAASGNGVSISVIHTPGVAINENTKLYPSALTADNLIKVSAITLAQVNPQFIPEYQLAKYANFGLDLVEVAAPVEPDFSGKVINGTSFAAPFISRLADQIKTINPKLFPKQISEILMKSCHVKNIDAAINATLDLKAKGNDSDVYQAMFNKKRNVREKLLHKIGDIILVKCGGVVLQEVALLCAQNTVSNKFSIHNACLEAQKEIRQLSNADLHKTQKFWDLRKI